MPDVVALPLGRPRRTRSALVATVAVAALSAVAPAALAAQSTGGAQLPNCPVGASTENGPFVGVLIDGQCTDLSSLIVRTSRTLPLWSLETSFQTATAAITLDIDFDGDPFISFGVATTNFGPGPVTYAFLFGTPIVPGTYNTARSTGGVSVTPPPDATASVSTSAVYPTFISGYGTVGGFATNLGVDLGTSTCTATDATETCNYGVTTNTFAPTFYNNLEALLTYEQTAAQSVAAWSGRVDLLDVQQVVPEPSAIILLATGIGALGLVARLRHTRG